MTPVEILEFARKKEGFKIMAYFGPLFRNTQ